MQRLPNIERIPLQEQSRCRTQRSEPVVESGLGYAQSQSGTDEGISSVGSK